MPNRQDHDPPLIDSIDDAIRWVQQLPDLRPREFRYHATRFRIVSQLHHALEHGADPPRGRCGSIRGDCPRDLRHAVQGQRRPNDAHEASERRAGRSGFATPRSDPVRQPSADDRKRLPLGNALSGRYLRLCCAHIFRQLGALDQGFVRFNREQNGCTATVLGENQRSLGRLDLPDERGNVRAKFRKRANILTRPSLPRSALVGQPVQKNVQVEVVPVQSLKAIVTPPSSRSQVFALDRHACGPPYPPTVVTALAAFSRNDR